jgi:hypothetical protein
MTTVILSNTLCDHTHKQMLAQAQLQGELDEIHTSDHINGFDENYKNNTLDLINSVASKQRGRITVYTSYIFDNNVLQNYAKLDFKCKLDRLFPSLKDYQQHPVLDFQNFVCSFNGTTHVSRRLLVAILQRFGYFNTEYCSKNFVFTVDKIDGHISDYLPEHTQLYHKFFISNDSEKFFNMVNTFFGHVRFDHAQNIYNLEHKLTRSFLHIVSETMATSYVPFVTEKFLYSIVTRGLFLSYAQPGWHTHVEKYYGFKRYTKLFDYRFDDIQNPVTRLVELMTMISKFSKLSSHDWHDLYLIEQDTIEYNYDHYFSKKYLEQFRQIEI